MRRGFSLSISVPIVLCSITVALSIAMLVGWILVLVRNRSLSHEVAQNTWLLVAGIVSLVMIATVLVMLSVFLVREILEVRRQDSFIDSVTHELKSPLASLHLCLETLERPELTETQRAALQTMMGDDVERLSVFINDVLEASRLSFGRRGYTLSDVGLASLVHRCAESVIKRYRLPDNAIQIHIEPDLHLYSDRTALETIFKNLLDNAAKYSTAPASIAITAQRRPDGRVHMYVRDNGIGVANSELKNIFDRFYRVAEEPVRQRKGTGLGLFVVALLVKSLSGKIWAESPGRGLGMTMHILLPASSTRAQG